MIIAIYVALAVIDAVATLYFAWRYREFSQISGRRILCERGSSILSLPRESFSTSPGHKPSLHTGDQRPALYSPLRLFLAVLVLRFYQEAEGVNRALCQKNWKDFRA